MNKNFLLATVAGEVTLLVLGGVFLASFFGIGNDLRVEPVWWALVLGALLYAAVLTVILGWKGVANGKEGFQAGAAFGALMGLARALLGYAGMEVETIAEVFGEALVGVVYNVELPRFHGRLVSGVDGV